jgi:hypothetical protein
MIDRTARPGNVPGRKPAPRAPGPLRAARAAAALALNQGQRSVFLDDDWYARCRLHAGLTRGQVDRALEDLATQGRIVLNVRSGLVVAEVPAEAPPAKN